MFIPKEKERETLVRTAHYSGYRRIVCSLPNLVCVCVCIVRLCLPACLSLVCVCESASAMVAVVVVVVEREKRRTFFVPHSFLPVPSFFPRVFTASSALQQQLVYGDAGHDCT